MITKLTREEVQLRSSTRPEFCHLYDFLKEENKELLQYKQLEEELGIDLIILFKALKEGFVTRHARYTGHGFYIDFERKCIHLGSAFMWSDTFYFKDYGKTWALTKEELLQEEK